MLPGNNHLTFWTANLPAKAGKVWSISAVIVCANMQDSTDKLFLTALLVLLPVMLRSVFQLESGGSLHFEILRQFGLAFFVANIYTLHALAHHTVAIFVGM